MSKKKENKSGLTARGPGIFWITGGSPVKLFAEHFFPALECGAPGFKKLNTENFLTGEPPVIQFENFLNIMLSYLNLIVPQLAGLSMISPGTSFTRPVALFDQ